MGYLVPGVMLKHKFINFSLSLSKEWSFLGATFIFVGKCWSARHLSQSFKFTIHQTRFATWQKAQQVNKSMFDVWLCGAAGCAAIHRVRTQHGRGLGGGWICLIKRIPLKSVMECWVLICGQWTQGEMSVVWSSHGTEAQSQKYRSQESFNVDIQSQKVSTTAEIEKRSSDIL